MSSIIFMIVVVVAGILVAGTVALAVATRARGASTRGPRRHVPVSVQRAPQQPSAPRDDTLARTGRRRAA